MNDLVLLIPIGVVTGVLLGSVGGGGSLIAVPALVYIGDQSVREAQAGALVAVIAAAAIGFASYLARDDVRWRAGLVLGSAAGVSSLAGSAVSRQLDPNLLLLLFSPIMVAGAIAMTRRRALSAPSFQRWRHGTSAGAVLKVAIVGLAVGWLTGLFGVGGGFVIVPALVLALGFGLAEAVGTSLLVVIIGSTVALADRLHGGDLDWGTIVPFSVAALVGVVLGGALAKRASSQSLAQGFAILVVLAAIYTAGRASMALF